LLTKAESTISNVFSAAANLFVEMTYTAVTMDEIARAAHVTKGALYHHFASKEDLYLALLHADLAQRKQRFIISTEGGGSSRSRLRRLCEAFLALPREKRLLLQLIRRDINVFAEPARAQLIQAYQEALPRVIESVIRDGIRDGELADTDARLLSWHFVAMVEVTLSRYADELFPTDNKRIDHVLDLFFSGAAQKEAE